jgi:acyl-CoA synthetase (NDP forming)
MDAIKGLLALKKNPVLQWGDVSIKEENGAIKVVRSYEGKKAVLTISSPTAYTIQMNA